MSWKLFDYVTFSLLLQPCIFLRQEIGPPRFICRLFDSVQRCFPCAWLAPERSPPPAQRAFIRNLSVLLMWKCNKVISRRVEQPPLVIAGPLCYCRPSVTYSQVGEGESLPLFSLWLFTHQWGKAKICLHNQYKPKICLNLTLSLMIECRLNQVFLMNWDFLHLHHFVFGPNQSSVPGVTRLSPGWLVSWRV